MSKPCIFCLKPTTVNDSGKFFDADAVFGEWASANNIIAPWRARFEDVKSALAWAAFDENNYGAHSECALTYAVERADFGARYPIGLIEMTFLPTEAVLRRRCEEQ